MTTDRDRTARIEFDAAAYLIYARKEHTMSTTQTYAPYINEWGEIDGIGAHEEDCSQHIGGICDCGEPIPDEGDYCHDCAQESVPEEVKAMSPIRSLIALAALALSLTAHTAHAAPYTPTAPIGCTVTYVSRDDLSASAVCAGGYLISKEDGPIDEWDIVYVIDTITVGPDANGLYWDWPVYE
jgi:hypothetical protein